MMVVVYLIRHKSSFEREDWEGQVSEKEENTSEIAHTTQHSGATDGHQHTKSQKKKKKIHEGGLLAQLLSHFGLVALLFFFIFFSFVSFLSLFFKKPSPPEVISSLQSWWVWRWPAFQSATQVEDGLTRLWSLLSLAAGLGRGVLWGLGATKIAESGSSAWERVLYGP